MTQTEQVIEVMRANGGYATFGKLNHLIDFSSWATKTPQASVRRIVQQSDAFFRIQPGLWALVEYKDEILRKFAIKENNEQSEELFTHGYYQGILVEIGNMRSFTTYVPAQDKKRKFLEQYLGEISKTIIIPEFTYPKLVDRAKRWTLFGLTNASCQILSLRWNTQQIFRTQLLNIAICKILIVIFTSLHQSIVILNLRK